MSFLTAAQGRFGLDFGPLDGPDVLENFDFDSFLHTEDNGAFGSLSNLAVVPAPLAQPAPIDANGASFGNINEDVSQMILLL